MSARTFRVPRNSFHRNEVTRSNHSNSPLIGGTDGHAKNYSLLIDAHDAIRLAPLYDVSSQLPYPDLIPRRVAMRIGDHYDIAMVDATDWRSLAHACAVDEERMISMLTGMAEALPDEVSAARVKALGDGLLAQTVAPLAEHLIRHAHERLLSITAKRAGARRPKKVRRARS